MTGPFITLTSGRVRDGTLEEFKRANGEIAALVERSEPRVIAFHAMLSTDGDRFLGMQFHPDAASMAFHLQVVREATAPVMDMLEIEELKVLGPSNEAVDALITSMSEAGVKVEHLPEHASGFTRSSAAL